MDIIETKAGTYLIDGPKVFALSGNNVIPIYIQSAPEKRKIENVRDWPDGPHVRKLKNVLKKENLNTWSDIEKISADGRKMWPYYGPTCERVLLQIAKQQGVDLDL